LPSIVFVVAKPIVGMPKKLITLGDHIKKKRLEENLFQKDIGKVIGTDNFTIVNWEKNSTKNIPAKYYPKIISKCHCTSDQIDKYKNKISEPLLDRIDMVLSVSPLPKKKICLIKKTQMQNPVKLYENECLKHLENKSNAKAKPTINSAPMKLIN
jgi:DNA-binding XRE family transcriptional regulator